VSRCQMLRFAPFQPEEVRAFLVGRDVPEERAELVAVLAEGSFGRALELSDDALDEHISVLDALEQLNPDDPAAVLDMAGDVVGQKDQLPAILTLLRAYFRDLMLLHHGAGTKRVALGWRREPMTRLAAGLTSDSIERALDALTHVEESLMGNVNARLAIEWLLFELSGALRH